jgi:hypothetical protein
LGLLLVILSFLNGSPEVLPIFAEWFCGDLVSILIDNNARLVSAMRLQEVASLTKEGSDLRVGSGLDIRQFNVA